MKWTREGLVEAGFNGFIPSRDLPTSPVPRGQGVYAILRDGTEPPTFLYQSPAGWFKGKDPSVGMPTLPKLLG